MHIKELREGEFERRYRMSQKKFYFLLKRCADINNIFMQLTPRRNPMLIIFKAQIHIWGTSGFGMKIRTSRTPRPYFKNILDENDIELQKFKTVLPKFSECQNQMNMTSNTQKSTI